MESTVGFQTRRGLIRQMVPRYQKASISQKGVLLDEIAATTGYARRYAMWLLNHPEEMQLPPRRRRQRTFGLEVQRVLFFVWQQANQICTKRLMPYLATHIEALERHGHLHLTDSCRMQLLSMSAATADRLLCGPRTHRLRGLATTRAGTLLKQQISIRTFEQGNETQPGFLEADVVAHCGSHLDGGYLSTLTLTDIATGWTECLPLLSKSAESIMSAFQQARTCFPFPILGLDTDSGCEFINECLLAYCEVEQITFTRGREGLKNDQCFIEQKNGAIVRQVVGYARSARAFCHWLVRHRHLPATPFADLLLPPVENRLPHPLEPEEWEQLLLACHPPKETGVIANQAAARNRAILWVLFETGMHVTEVCRLRLGDVDREQGILKVQGKGGAVRWLTLGHEGRRSLLAYLDEYRLKQATHFKQGGANAEPLFLSEAGRPLTKSTIGLVFGRLRERAGMSTKTISASLLRKNFCGTVSANRGRSARAPGTVGAAEECHR